jgi:hypothetical protein
MPKEKVQAKITKETKIMESNNIEKIEIIKEQNQEKYPIILSFDVGVIHLAYCLMTKKEFTKSDGTKRLDWYILDWNNIDLTNRDEQKCHCGAKAKLSNMVGGVLKYYCKTHGKKVDTITQEFNVWTKECPDKKSNKCEYQSKPLDETSYCGKFAGYYRMINDQACYLCTTHAKQVYKSEVKSSQLKSFKLKSSTTLNFDDVKYSLMIELENKPNLLTADYVVIENQPSFKNPRMKSIATTLYDYYLIRGVIDKPITKSNISQVKFMSPSNKLKLADEGDTKQLIKAKGTDDTKAYKLTKSLGIKYCLDLTTHLDSWQKHFNSHKKKDDLADAFLQGAYFYTNNIKENKEPKLKQVNQTDKQVNQTDKQVKTLDLTKEISSLELVKPSETEEPIIKSKTTKRKPKKASPKEIEL